MVNHTHILYVPQGNYAYLHISSYIFMHLLVVVCQPMKTLHIVCALTDLHELKDIPDQQVKEKNIFAGHFRLKPRVESTPSLLPITLNPVQWAVNR